MDTDTKIARTITRVHKMRLLDVVAEMGLSEVTRDTFIYVDLEGNLAAIEKRDRNSYVEDASDELGYVFDHEYAADIRQVLK